MNSKTPNSGGNGKSHITPDQLKEAISQQEQKCNKVFLEYFSKFDRKLDKITDTLGYVNTLLSERLSNHSARLGSLESEVAKAKREN